MSYDDRENAFGALLDELETLHDKRGNHMGGILRKSHTPPVYRIAKVTRSEPVAFKNLMPPHRRDYTGELDRQIECLNKAMTSPRAATISHKPRRMDLRKAMSDFNANMRKSMAAGELTPDQVCLLEARMNRMTQRPMTGLL